MKSEKLKSLLRDKSYPLSIIHLKETASTNTYLMQLLSKEFVEPYTIVVTDNQTSGRGQHNKTWIATPGMNLTFSILLKNNHLSPDKLFVINKVVALSIVQYLEMNHNIFAKIKWPNDIFVNWQKISGILIENSITGSQINCIAGIGLNINQVSFNKVKSPAVSIKNITGKSFTLRECLKQLCNIIIYNMERIIYNSSFDVSKSYTEHLMFLGEERVYKYNEKNISGQIIGVNEIGQLIFNESITKIVHFFDHGQFDYNLLSNSINQKTSKLFFC